MTMMRKRRPRPTEVVPESTPPVDIMEARPTGTDSNFWSLLVEKLLKEFRVLECSACGQTLGFQDRLHPDRIICSPKCLLSDYIPNDGQVRKEDESISQPEGRRLKESDYHVDDGSDDTPEENFTLENNQHYFSEFSIDDAKLDEILACEIHQDEEECYHDVMHPHDGVNTSHQVWLLDDMKLTESVGDSEPCEISHVCDSGDLYVRALADAVAVQNIQKSIQDYCQQAQRLNRLPRKGEVLIARYAYDGEYYRAAVLNLNRWKLDVHVKFIDYGNEALVRFWDCLPLTEHLKNPPIYGVHWVIEGIAQDFTMSDSALAVLQEAMSLCTVVRKVVENNNGDEQNVVYIREANMSWGSLIHHISLNQSIPNGSLPSSSSVKAKQSHIFMFPWQRFLDDMKRSRNLDDETEVIISFKWSYSKLCVVAVEDRQAKMELQNAIERHIAEVQPIYRPLNVGEVYLARYSDDEFYRAVVKKIHNNGKVHVEFLDDGDEAVVSPLDVRELNNEINEHPIYGITLTMPEIPDAANNLEIDQLEDLCDHPRPCVVQVECRTSDCLSGKLWISPQTTWNSIIMDELRSRGYELTKKTFNPWSDDIIQLLRGFFGPGEGAADLGLLENIYGRNYLTLFSRLCFKSYFTKIEDFQLTTLFKMEGTEAGWSDLREEFYYDKTAIPEARIPVGTKVHLKVTNFEDLHCLSGYVVDEPWASFRDELTRMLSSFCEHSICPDDFIPKENQVCLVKMPTWKEIDSLMNLVRGSHWRPKRFRRTDHKVEDHIHAGKWFRGIRQLPLDEMSEFGSRCFEFWLPDVARAVPIHFKNVRPAVFRFTGIPNLGIQGCLLPQSLDEMSPEDRKASWYKMFPRGTIIPCTVVGHDGDLTMFKMPRDIEAKMLSSDGVSGSCDSTNTCIISSKRNSSEA